VKKSERERGKDGCRETGRKIECQREIDGEGRKTGRERKREKL
jgi:hypothetical protein